MSGPAGFKRDADGGERLGFSDAVFAIKASADTTGGAFTVIEESAPLDTPLHVHENEDELWYVLEGSMCFRSATQSSKPGRVRSCSDRGEFPTRSEG